MIKRSVAVAALAVSMATILFTGASRAQDPPPPGRFDVLVRADFFAGFAGDTERFARGMNRCEEALAADPDHADALVWHGAGLLFMAGEAAARNDLATAGARFQRGTGEMDRANRLAPDSLNVMIVRAVSLNASVPNVRDPARRLLMARAAVEGLERALAIQTPYFAYMSEHSRGELLGGLAEGWSRLGEADRARVYLERMVNELPDTRYQYRARARLADGPGAGPISCLTCHHDQAR